MYYRIMLTCDGEFQGFLMRSDSEWRIAHNTGAAHMFGAEYDARQQGENVIASYKESEPNNLYRYHLVH